jgi:hypothetical protein
MNSNTTQLEESIKLVHFRFLTYTKEIVERFLLIFHHRMTNFQNLNKVAK